MVAAARLTAKPNHVGRDVVHRVSTDVVHRVSTEEIKSNRRQHCQKHHDGRHHIQSEEIDDLEDERFLFGAVFGIAPVLRVKIPEGVGPVARQADAPIPHGNEYQHAGKSDVTAMDGPSGQHYRRRTAVSCDEGMTRLNSTLKSSYLTMPPTFPEAYSPTTILACMSENATMTTADTPLCFTISHWTCCRKNNR